MATLKPLPVRSAPRLMRSASLSNYVELVRSLGRDPTPFLRTVGLTAQDLSDTEALIPRDAARELARGASDRGPSLRRVHHAPHALGRARDLRVDGARDRRDVLDLRHVPQRGGCHVGLVLPRELARAHRERGCQQSEQQKASTACCSRQ